MQAQAQIRPFSPAQLAGYIALCIILFTMLFAASAHAAGPDFPKLSGRVVDQADLLSPAEEAALTQKLLLLENETQRQLVVATISDLKGYDISDYGYQLGRHWAIGDKERDDGVILIIAPSERKMRIEVGYGLEPILTDALSSDIIRNDITPYFKEGNLPAGINAGVDKISTILKLSPEDRAKLAAKAAERKKDNSGNGLLFFWIIIFIIFFIIPMFSRGKKGKKYRKGRHGTSPVIIWGGGFDDNDKGGGFGGFGGGGFGGGGFGGGGGGFGGGGASGGW
ncbi:methanol dehydrogenase [Sphingorhabdus lutea]|uniref:Methanol dehydrogenase n=1 Tax=Sphingorhabdus lutea TaxID=1913578 RepID=A0A1L3JEX5_9SPHN|nr:TPM domain-containing protein [Sphingorhabdus lutea]APG63670.1 methanol dehydrogenase [Sphingorhabdus lutea]